eukprot:GILJ01004767.1.p1 GENE.GILJ01004767.1~~GILJ01004767.1.p1  ORF type:complete len:133 (-),score=18.33 GILJ01004767.1:283-642(-)
MSNSPQDRSTTKSVAKNTAAFAGLSALAGVGIFTTAYITITEQRADKVVEAWNQRVPARLAIKGKELGPGVEDSKVVRLARRLGLSAKRAVPAAAITIALKPFKLVAVGSILAALHIAQ